MLDKILITILIFEMMKEIKNQGAYGQVGNSQVGTNSGINGNNNAGINSIPSNTPQTLPSNTIQQPTPLPSNSQNYGQNGNSQLGTTSQNNNNNPLGPQDKALISDCNESDSISVCVSKPSCCHVTNSYSGYTYSACIDAKSSNNFYRFCSTFYLLNNKEGFVTSGCLCFGNFQYYGNATFLKLYSIYIAFAFVLILII
jgi:hypothetical protein